jgi:putative ABC transport system permease protein
MVGLYATLSLRYLRRRWFRALLIVASIALGVAMLVATRALNQTMDRAAASAANPLAGVADLLIGGGDTAVDASLAEQVAKLDGVQSAMPRVFQYVKLPRDGDRTALLVGLNLLQEKKAGTDTRWQIEHDPDLETRFIKAALGRLPPVIVGKRLDDALPQGGKELEVLAPGQKSAAKLKRVGAVNAGGPAAALGGDVLVLNLDDAVRVLGMRPGSASRIDVALNPGANREKARQRIARLLAGRAEVRTPEEQNHSVQNVMAPLQVGLLLCGVAALVIGLFLVYNALSVSVAERRHEIGILRGVGATRGQIRRLFAGEAAVLGLAGSLLGIPLGIGLANLVLQPVQGTLADIFGNLDAPHVEVGRGLLLLALLAGVLTAVAAAVVPAFMAARERPAEAVRRIPVAPTWGHHFVQLAVSLALLLGGTACILGRDLLPPRFGMYGGLGMVLISALMATPLLTALLARMLQPLARRFLGIETRLAADNLVRAPGRTGLVIAALAAGVALVMQTAGTIRSNRIALRRWVQENIGADLIVSSGGPASAGSQGLPMSASVGDLLRAVPGVEAALPIHLHKQSFRDTQILMTVLSAGDFYRIDSQRHPPVSGLELYRRLSEQRDGVIVSENFSVLHGVKEGDTLTLTSLRGPVKVRVLGKLVDYSWNTGSLIMDRKLYLANWGETRVDMFDVYLKPEADGQAVQAEIERRHKAKDRLWVLTRAELQGHIDGMIERLYGIAFGQQLVVMVVAALGVVMALLISVLQRRRELGLLRAIGASRAQVVRCVAAEATLMGVFGTVIGLLVGVPLQWYALQVVIFEETGYSFAVHIPWTPALMIAGASILTAWAAGLGPALYAGRQRIPEAIALE